MIVNKKNNKLSILIQRLLSGKKRGYLGYQLLIYCINNPISTIKICNNSTHFTTL
jgi:hypothetical protein